MLPRSTSCQSLSFAMGGVSHRQAAPPRADRKFEIVRAHGWSVASAHRVPDKITTNFNPDDIVDSEPVLNPDGPIVFVGLTKGHWCRSSARVTRTARRRSQRRSA